MPKVASKHLRHVRPRRSSYQPTANGKGNRLPAHLLHLIGAQAEISSSVSGTTGISTYQNHWVSHPKACALCQSAAPTATSELAHGTEETQRKQNEGTCNLPFVSLSSPDCWHSLFASLSPVSAFTLPALSLTLGLFSSRFLVDCSTLALQYSMCILLPLRPQLSLAFQCSLMLAVYTCTV